MAVNALRETRSPRSGRWARKGVFFTLMAILVVTFLLIYQQQGTTAQRIIQTETSSTIMRVSVMDRYVSTFEQHAAQSLRIATYVALQNRSREILRTGIPIADMNATFAFCLNNATAPHNCLNSSQTINASLDQLVRIARENLSIETTYRVNNVSITEEQPYTVLATMNISYNVSDAIARFEITRIIRTTVDMEGVMDPAYALHNRTRNVTLTRNFTRTTVIDGTFTNTSFLQHYNARAYRVDPNGSTVLQRYRGIFDGNGRCPNNQVCGIESIVHSADLQAAVKADPRLVNWSFVDWQFFNRNKFELDCNTRDIAGMELVKVPDPYLRLDFDHVVNTYNISTSGGANYTCKKP
jgi:hypothetical protein